MSFVQRCRERRLSEGEKDEGFTLIELLVVLLIIGILLAIAIPTFLSVTKGANNTASQSNLQTALTGADTFYTEQSQTFTGLLGGSGVSTITAIDTGVSYVTSSAASTTSHVVSVDVVSSGNVLVLTSFSPGTNDCWGILDIKTAQTTAVLGEKATGTYYFDLTPHTATTSTCKASAGAVTALPSGGSISTTGFSSVTG